METHNEENNLKVVTEEITVARVKVTEDNLIKNCPFCGHKAELVQRTSSTIEFDCGSYLIFCSGCGASTGESRSNNDYWGCDPKIHFVAAQNAIENWNARNEN